MIRQKARFMRRPLDIRTFVCPVCGVVIPACKYKNVTRAGHVKTMYCFKCREVRDFVQVDRLEEKDA